METEQGALEKAKSVALAHAIDQQETANFYREQGTSLDKWLLATQLSVCGGAIVALLSTTAVNEASRLYAVIWFFVGLFFALLIGNLRVASMYGSAVNHSKAAKMFARFSRDGDKTLLDKAWVEEVSVAESKRDKVAKALRFLPYLCVIVGAFITAEGL